MLCTAIPLCDDCVNNYTSRRCFVTTARPGVALRCFSVHGVARRSLLGFGVCSGSLGHPVSAKPSDVLPTRVGVLASVECGLLCLLVTGGVLLVSRHVVRLWSACAEGCAVW